MIKVGASETGDHPLPALRADLSRSAGEVYVVAVPFG